MAGHLQVEMDRAPGEQWDAYVRSHPAATAHHLSAWAWILKAAYRFKPVYLSLRDSGGEVHGVLPLVHRHGPVSGSRLNSLPAVRWAGPLAGSPEQEARLMQSACELVREGKARRLTARSITGGYDDLVPGLAAHTDHPSWRVTLPSDPESFLKQLKQRSKNRYRDVRKAEASGLTIREGTSDDDLRHFYRLYLATMRRHRALPRSYRQFAVAKRLLEPAGVLRFLVAEHEGTIVAGGLFHFFGDVVDLLYNASDDKYLHLRPNHAIYWKAIQLSIAGGYRYYDLGSGLPGSPLGEFKRRWAAEQVPRFRYTYSVDTGAEAPARRAMGGARRLRSRRRSRLARNWSRAPLGLTRVAGTVAYRYL